MEYGINIAYLMKEIGMKRAAELAAQAGFRVLDYTPSVRKDDWEKSAEAAMAVFGAAGLSVHQTHAPFDRYGGLGDMHMTYVERTLEATRLLGGQYMVVHGDEFDFDRQEYTPERALAYNHELFLPIVEKAAAWGIKIAFENVFEDSVSKTGKPRFCSKSEDLRALIESFHSDAVCCCWDFGHAGVAFGEEQPDKIRELGQYIECTHVHDCGHGRDLHLPPFLGNIDWAKCAEAMREIPYRGNLIFEMVYGKIPEEMGEVFVTYLVRAAERLRFS